MEKRNDDINLTYENLDTRDFFEDEEINQVNVNNENEVTENQEQDLENNVDAIVVDEVEEIELDLEGNEIQEEPVAEEEIKIDFNDKITDEEWDSYNNEIVNDEIKEVSFEEKELAYLEEIDSLKKANNILQDSLTKEREKLNEMVSFKVFENLLFQIVDLRESYVDYATRYRDRNINKLNDPNIKETLKRIQGIVYELEDVLENNDVTFSQSKEEDEYNIKYHEAIDTIETNDESLKRKIAFSYGYHYFYKGEIIKREKVALYKYKVINN